MKLIKHIKAALAILLAGSGYAFSAPGDLTVLHPFTASASDGGAPMSSVLESGGKLYGLSTFGGVSNMGVVFRMNMDGSSYTNLHAFTGVNGKYPFGGLLMYSGNLYGMTSRGGSNNAGVLFQIGTNGTGFSVRHHFDDRDDRDGALPWGGLIQSGGKLYGMTYNGGLTNRGAVFSVDASTWAYTNLHRFNGGPADGKHPKGDLLLDGGRLYGMTSEGGTNNNGVIFSMAPDGSGYRIIRDFLGNVGGGANPSGGLVKDGDYLYGTTPSGDDNAGTVFRVGTNGADLTYLRIFSGRSNEGAVPYGTLLKHDTKLYGTTRFGGTNFSGVIFSLGGSYSNQCVWPSQGELIGSLIAVGDQLIGTSMKGGVSNAGTVFAFDASTGDVTVAWCAITWIDGGGLDTTLEGDANTRRMYIRHSTAGGPPDYAYVGYGQNAGVDDGTWTWLPMTDYGTIGADYEYTGTLGRASGGNYLAAAKFVKGLHVYYPQAAIGSWGNWDTQLYATNTWIVTPLTCPSDVYARFMNTNRIDVHFRGDGAHWVVVFRKSGTSSNFTPAVDGTDYYTGTDYGAQGECVYRGDVSVFTNSGLPENTVYHYRLYTENYSYYSTGAVASASTDPNRDDDGDVMPNRYEVDGGFNPGLGADGAQDADNDGALNWKEYVAGTDPNVKSSVFEILDNAYSNTSFVISWSSVAGKRYSVYRTTNLVSGLPTVLVTNAMATPPDNVYTDSVPDEVATYFYSVKVGP